MLLNRDRALETMQAQGLDAIVAGTLENVLYLSDFDMAWAAFSFGSKAFAILPASGDMEPTLVCPDYGLPYLSEQPTWMPRVATFGAFRIFVDESSELEGFERTYIDLMAATDGARLAAPDAALVQALRDLGLASACLGVDDPRTIALLREQLPEATISEGRDVFRTVRAVKTPAEIDRLRRGARANEAGLQAAADVAGDGVNYRELGNAWRRETAAAGGQPEFWYAGGGRRGSGLYPTQDYTLRAGDAIRYECGGRLERYWFDTGRTGSIGPATEKLTKYFTALQAAHAEVEPLIEPGRRAAELPEMLTATARKSGIPKFEGTAWGHGLGLEAYDLPRVTLDSNEKLEAGMVFALESPYFEIGWGGIQLENTYLVTERGAERLTVLPTTILESTSALTVART